MLLLFFSVVIVLSLGLIGLKLVFLCVVLFMLDWYR